MSLKDKITSILFSQKSKEEMGEESLAQQVENEPESQENLSFASVDETVLKLPADHPLHQLHSIRRKEAGYLPVPRLCLDEDGVLPEDLTGEKPAAKWTEKRVRVPAESGQDRE